MKKTKFRLARGISSGHANITNIIGVTCLGILALLGIAFVAPSSYRTDASALSCIDGEQCEQNDLSATALDIIVRPAIAIGAQTSVQIDITPNLGSRGFASKTASLNVSTNSSSGYSIYMWTFDGTGDLHSTNSGETSVIASVEAPVAEDGFAANSWGYRVASDSSDLYNPLPTTSDTAIVVSDGSTGEAVDDNYNVDFGVNIDSNLPSGQYYNSVVFSAVANPITVSSLYDLTYMQDMTTEVCDNTALHATKQLVDTRDGKSYWIAKLKDGHCWMTQNLALDLSTERPLTVADTNLVAGTSYAPNVDTASTLPVANLPTSATQASWNFGQLILAVPAYGTACSVSGKLTGDLATNCAKVSIVDVSDTTKFKPTYSAEEHQSWALPDGQTVNDTLVAVNCTEWTDDETLGHICTAGTYDAHYLIGNYYDWGSASANSLSVNTTGGSYFPVQSDICPRGWKLPSQNYANPLNEEFGKMLNLYGFVTNGNVNQTVGNPTHSVVDGQEYYAYGSPTHYAAFGFITYNTALTNFGTSASYFSSFGSTRHDYVSNGGASVVTLVQVNVENILIKSVHANGGIVGDQIRCISR